MSALTLLLLAAAPLPQGLSLSVQLPKSLLVNRFAPNTVTLTAGGQRQTLRLSGAPHPDPQFAEYFAATQPLQFELKAARPVRTGVLSGELFVCDQLRRECLKQTFRLPVELNTGRTLYPLELQLGVGLRLKP